MYFHLEKFIFSCIAALMNYYTYYVVCARLMRYKISAVRFIKRTAMVGLNGTDDVDTGRRSSKAYNVDG